MADRSQELLSKHVERILDALPDGVFISDASGTSLRVNRMYEQLTGLTQAQLQGKNVRCLVEEGVFTLAFLAFVGRHRAMMGHVEKLMGVMLIVFGILIATNSVNLIADFLLRNFDWSATLQ